jgi:hypothetical protein
MIAAWNSRAVPDVDDELADLRAIAKAAKKVLAESRDIEGSMRDVAEVPTSPLVDLHEATDRHERTGRFCALPPYDAVPSLDMAEVERLVSVFERSISEPCNDPKQAASEYLAARRALLDHVNGRTPAVDGLVEALKEAAISCNLTAMHMSNYKQDEMGELLIERNRAVRDLCYTALAAVKTKGGE